MLATGATLMHTIISWIIPVQLLIFYLYIVQTCYTIFQVLKPSIDDIFTPDKSKNQSQTDQSKEGGQTKKSAMSKSSFTFFDNAGKKLFILFEDLGSVQFFFLSGNVHNLNSRRLKLCSYKIR